jgi:hypothetical protein
MTVHTLNTSSPAGASFEITATSLVQTSVLSNQDVTVILEMDETGAGDSGSPEWSHYNITLNNDKPQHWNLAPNHYRVKVINPTSVKGDVKVSVSFDTQA